MKVNLHYKVLSLLLLQLLTVSCVTVIERSTPDIYELMNRTKKNVSIDIEELLIRLSTTVC